jgi:hypothetical protein
VGVRWPPPAACQPTNQSITTMQLHINNTTKASSASNEVYTHAYRLGKKDPTRYYWCTSMTGDHSEFYAKHGYATLVNHERDARSIFPVPDTTLADYAINAAMTSNTGKTILCDEAADEVFAFLQPYLVRGTGCMFTYQGFSLWLDTVDGDQFLFARELPILG